MSLIIAIISHNAFQVSDHFFSQFLIWTIFYIRRIFQGDNQFPISKKIIINVAKDEKGKVELYRKEIYIDGQINSSLISLPK